MAGSGGSLPSNKDLYVPVYVYVLGGSTEIYDVDEGQKLHNIPIVIQCDRNCSLNIFVGIT